MAAQEETLMPKIIAKPGDGAKLPTGGKNPVSHTPSAVPAPNIHGTPKTPSGAGA
jgi:hypothetical protein